jgi:hypothetical protein
MTTIPSLFRDPDYEQPAEGCELQARWPGLVGAARSSSIASDLPVFYEWAPLPGGLFLIGVGHAGMSTHRDERSLRETILARMLAGCALDESVQRAFVETGAEGSDASVCYALVDPAQADMSVVGHGPRATLIHVVGGGAGVFRPLTPSTGSRIELRDGDGVLLVAHTSLWGRHIHGVIDRSLLEREEPSDKNTVLQLCGRVPILLTGESASAVVCA